jgi:predicted transcriptional regulator
VSSGEIRMDRSTKIINIVEKNPGIKFNELKREAGLENGVLSYHARKLEVNGNVKIIRKSGDTRFYPLCVTDEEYCIISNLRRNTPRNILIALLEDEPLTFNTLVQKSHKSASMVSQYLSGLVYDEIILFHTINSKKEYYLKNAVMVREIIQKYNPILLERTAYNLADTFSSL